MGIQREIYTDLYENKLITAEMCSPEDQQKYIEMAQEGEELPDNIIHDYLNTYYDVGDIKPEEVMQMLLMKQLKMQSTIKSYLTFFVVLTVISILAWFIFLASNM